MKIDDSVFEHEFRDGDHQLAEISLKSRVVRMTLMTCAEVMELEKVNKSSMSSYNDADNETGKVDKFGTGDRVVYKAKDLCPKVSSKETSSLIKVDSHSNGVEAPNRQ